MYCIVSYKDKTGRDSSPPFSIQQSSCPVRLNAETVLDLSSLPCTDHINSPYPQSSQLIDYPVLSSSCPRIALHWSASSYPVSPCCPPHRTLTSGVALFLPAGPRPCSRVQKLPCFQTRPKAVFMSMFSLCPGCTRPLAHHRPWGAQTRWRNVLCRAGKGESGGMKGWYSLATAGKGGRSRGRRKQGSCTGREVREQG